MARAGSISESTWADLLALLPSMTAEEACRQPGMPTIVAFRAKVYRDPAYKAAVRSIRAENKVQRRPPKFTQADWAELTRRIEAVGLVDACRSPGMPSLAATAKRRAKNEAFGKAVDAILTARASREAEFAALDWAGTLERIRQGIGYKRQVGQPGVPTWSQWNTRRRTDPAFRQQVRDAIQEGEVVGGAPEHRITPEKRSRIIALAQDGMTIAAITALPGMPSGFGLRRAMRRHQAVGDVFRQARESAARRGYVAGLGYTPDQRERVLQVLSGRLDHSSLPLGSLPTPETLRKWGRQRSSFGKRVSALLATRGNAREEEQNLLQSLSQNDVWRAVNAAVSAGLPSFIRDDVIGEMVADVLGGSLDSSDIKVAARHYVSAYHRQAGTWASRSFDAPVFADGSGSLHERI